MMLKVTKRSGQLEELNVEQIHKMVDFACEGLSDVSMSSVVMGAQIQFADGITTSTIQNLLVKSASQKITLEEPNYQYVAARLLLFELYKSLYPNWNTEGFPNLYEHITSNTDVYDTEFLTSRYSKAEFDIISDAVDYSRDYNFTYSGIQQLVDKYLLKNRITGKIYETPQQMYALVAMTIFADYPVDTRIAKVIDCYHAISTWKINLPTPVLVSIRSKNKGAASCMLIDIGDSIDGIAIANAQILKGTAQNMGMGLNISNIRNVGSPVRNGEVIHTGIIPILKTIEASIKACTQSSRGGCFTPDSQVYVVTRIKINGNQLSPGATETYHNNIDTVAGHYNRELKSYGLNGVYLELVRIDEVKVGQYALSYDTECECYQVNEILTVWTPIIEPEDQLSITLYDGNTINTTNSHKLWVYKESSEDYGAWLRADEVHIGDSLLHVNGELREIQKVVPTDGYAATYYDLEIAESHCYFVGDGADFGTDDLYLSHNSATVHIPFFNLEIEDVIMLKDNSGTSENRIKNLDYSIGMCKLFLQRFIENKEISLFSSSEVPGLVEAFGTPEFDALYVHYESSDVRRKIISSSKLFLEIVKQRSQTGRIYIYFVDNINIHSGFRDNVQMSNLCEEVLQPSRFIDKYTDLI